MGIDTDGGMIVGRSVEDILGKGDHPDPEDSDFYDANGMDIMNPWYDCGEENWVVGFSVKDILVSGMDEKWLKDIQGKSKKFEDIFKIEAKLIGMQDVW